MSRLMSHHFRSRLAPSPTGAQHLGNARTYLLAWLEARSVGGEIVLRIEDIDHWRNVPGAKEQLLADFRWLGLDWDGEPVVQSQRLEAHREALNALKRREQIYPCTCSRSDIQNAASAPHAEHEPPTYPGTCSGRSARDAESLTVPYAWRFRVDDTPAFDDAVCGRVELDLKLAGGDFVVWRSADTPAYQLAVVVDDAAAGITRVVRGDDLLTSTPRQLLIARALGLAPPSYAHVPMVLGENAQRLAKRHGDTRLASLASAGVPVERVIGFLAWSCGLIERNEPTAATELIPHFSWSKLKRQPFTFTAKHLRELMAG